MNRYKILVLTVVSFLTVLPDRGFAQSFDIEEAGEVTLGTNIIASPGFVQQYFGMNVNGTGQGVISVRAGSERSEKPYEFFLESTRFVSYLLAHSLGEEISPAFRRGVKGTIDIEIRDASGVVHDLVSVQLNVERPRRECTKFPLPRVRRCVALDLDRASSADRRKFVTRFVKSIRGPIVLEP